MEQFNNSHQLASDAGVVSGIPNVILRGEGLLALLAALTAYHFQGNSWLLFAALFLVPDIFMLGYLRDNRLGAICYNVGHTYLSPALLLTVSWVLGLSMGLAVATIWICHIGFDRLVGYGLKYQRGFKFNHLSASA